jgi:hypothetical protein
MHRVGDEDEIGRGDGGDLCVRERQEGECAY